MSSCTDGLALDVELVCSNRLRRLRALAALRRDASTQRRHQTGDPILVEAEIEGESENPLLGILTPFDLPYAPRFRCTESWDCGGEG